MEKVFKKNVNEVVVVVLSGLFFIAVTVFIGIYQRSTLEGSDILSSTDEVSPTDTDRAINSDGSEAVNPEEIVFNAAKPTNTATPASSSATPRPDKIATDPTIEVGGGENSAASTPKPTPTGSKIRAFGSVTEGDNRVDFWVDFPSNGGAMSGQGSGVCDGFIRGTFFMGSRVASGSLDGTCTVDGEEISVTGQYSGNIRLEDGRGGGTWEGEDDNNNSKNGSWEIDFDPI